MGNTTNGLPYPEGTDPLAQGAAAIKALATAVDPYVGDTGWSTIQAGTSTTPTIKIRRIGKDVWVFIDGAINNLANAASVTYAGIVPAALRPTVGNIRGMISLDHRAGAGVIATAGDVVIWNQTGAARASVNASLIPYPLG